jgi:ArsR family transcriptional regulator, lead/cadmium/zinc/bismuth-responsive transcriptional repressor
MVKQCCYTLLPTKSIQQASKEADKIPFDTKAAFFKTLGDTTKLKILFVLSKFDQLSVCDISKIINVSVSAVSHQLLKLKYMNLIECQKSGRMVLYTLKDKEITSYISFS